MAKPSDLFTIIDHYIAELFALTDDALEFALNQARGAGLPEIQVSATQGRFIYLLAKIMGARRILEIGTLGGYSTIWLARALPEDGRLVTLEINPRHAEVAASSVARAGLSTKVEIMVGSALQTLPKLCAEAAEPFDLVFLDADKENSPITILTLCAPSIGGRLFSLTMLCGRVRYWLPRRAIRRSWPPRL